MATKPAGIKTRFETKHRPTTIKRFLKAENERQVQPFCGNLFGVREANSKSSHLPLNKHIFLFAIEQSVSEWMASTAIIIGKQFGRLERAGRSPALDD